MGEVNGLFHESVISSMMTGKYHAGSVRKLKFSCILRSTLTFLYQSSQKQNTQALKT